MKKSEMIEIIKEELLNIIEVYNEAYDRHKEHIIKHKADEMLAMLEGFGMLPPPSKYKQKTQLIDESGNVKFGLYYLNKWEEDESSSV